jgi:hypothetical protein
MNKEVLTLTSSNHKEKTSVTQINKKMYISLSKNLHSACYGPRGFCRCFTNNSSDSDEDLMKQLLLILYFYRWEMRHR